MRKRAIRIRKKIINSSSRPRLSVYRSNRHIYAQIIDDLTGKTLASACTKNVTLKKGATKVEAASAVGKAIALSAIKAKVKKVKFDRGPYKYHGRVKAVAEKARENGLEF